MKSFKTILAFAVATAFAVTAQAASPEKIYIVGSSAYRAHVHTAIINQMAASGALTYKYAYTSSSGASNVGVAPGKDAPGSGASQQYYEGKINGVDVIIETNWSGSVAGIQVVSGTLPIKFMSPSVSGTAATNAGTLIAAPVDFAATPNVAMSDVFQASTPFTANPLTEITSAVTGVGVVPFVWVVNKDYTTNNTLNMTPQIAQFLFTVGAIPYSMFTGNSGDQTTIVYATGRDADSGTRLTAFAESGVGVATQVNHYLPVFGGAVLTGSVSAGGSGYTSAPSVGIYGGGGNGYTSAPVVTISGGGGSGATATAVLTGSSVTAVNINNQGTGYTSAPTVAFSATQAAGFPASTVAKATTSINAAGKVYAATVANPGSGATGTVALTGNSVTTGNLALTIVNGGSGFQSAPSVAFIASGPGTGAAASTTAGNYTVSNLVQYPPITVNGIDFVAGNGGFASGGTLAVALGSTGVSTNNSLPFGAGYLVSYLGTSDAATATGLTVSGTFSGGGLGARTLLYNGVPYSLTAVREGQYTFWGYEHMYALGLNGNSTTVATAIAGQIADTDAIVTLGSMNVSRAVDGGTLSSLVF